MTVLQSDRRFRPAAEPPERPPYAIVADADAPRSGVAVRECADLMACRIVVSPDGDDAARVIEEWGPPSLLIASVSLPGRPVLSIVETLLRANDALPIVLWAGERDVREFARSALGGRSIRILRPFAPPMALRACLAAIRDQRDAGTAHEEPPQEGLQALAERARKRLGVAGAAVYGRAGDTATFRVAVAWMPDAPMPPLPPMLPAAVDTAISSGKAIVWPDRSSDERAPDAAASEVMRSLAVVPLIRDGRPAGALCVFDAKPHALTEADLPVLAALSGGVLPVAKPAEAAPRLIDARLADIVVQRELARARRERLSMSIMLFGAHGEPRSPIRLDAVGSTVARAVRANDLVIRWNDSHVLVLLTGVPSDLARDVAERVRTSVETSVAHAASVSGAIGELRPSEAFDAAVTRTIERLELIVRGGEPRIA